MTQPPGHHDRPEFCRLVELVCLCYHEARNVRHAKSKLDNTERYRALVSLPSNRQMAWEQMEKARLTALNSAQVEQVLRVFRNRFSLDLDDLSHLFKLSIWRDSPYGGNAWGPICDSVAELANNWDVIPVAQRKEKLEAVLQMNHNTGRVGDKLMGLSQPTAES